MLFPCPVGEAGLVLLQKRWPHGRSAHLALEVLLPGIQRSLVSGNPEVMLVCREDSHPAALPKLPFALTWWEAVRVLLDRQWKLTVRDGSLVRGRIIQVSQPLPLRLSPAAATCQARATPVSSLLLWACI